MAEWKYGSEEEEEERAKMAKKVRVGTDKWGFVLEVVNLKPRSAENLFGFLFFTFFFLFNSLGEN